MRRVDPSGFVELQEAPAVGAKNLSLTDLHTVHVNVRSIQAAEERAQPFFPNDQPVNAPGLAVTRVTLGGNPRDFVITVDEILALIAQSRKKTKP